MASTDLDMVNNLLDDNFTTMTIIADEDGLDSSSTTSDCDSCFDLASSIASQTSTETPLTSPEIEDWARPPPLLSTTSTLPFPVPSQPSSEFSVVTDWRYHRPSNSSVFSSTSHDSVPSLDTLSPNISSSVSPISPNLLQARPTSLWSDASEPSLDTPFPASHRFAYPHIYPINHKIWKRSFERSYDKKARIRRNWKIPQGNLESWTEVTDLDTLDGVPEFPDLETGFETLEMLLGRLCGPNRYHSVEKTSQTDELKANMAKTLNFRHSDDGYEAEDELDEDESYWDGHDNHECIKD